MKLSEYQCQPIGLEHHWAVDAIRLQAGHTLSSHAFVSLYLWQRAMGLSVCLQEHAFFVPIRSRGEQAWMFPCGGTAEKIEFLKAGVNTPSFSLHYVREEDMQWVEDCMPGQFTFSEARGDAEYVYNRAAQLALSGRAYKNLRVKVRRMEDRHCWQISPLDVSSQGEAEKIMHGWQCRSSTQGDLDVGLLALRQFERLGMQGFVLRNEEGLQGVALGSLIAPGVFDLHITKTITSGLDAYLRWALYQRLPDTVEWIDQEEDLNLPGLRTHKMEAKPDHLVPLWIGVPKV